MFILDATNYSRWLPFHVRDMKSLPASVKQMFQAGYFTVTKTTKRFSSISIDQAHEQTNKDVKSSGGATGLFHDHLALLQWSIVAPEVSRMVNEFQQFLPSFLEPDDDYQHQEETKSFQNYFLKSVKRIYETMTPLNPWKTDHADILKVDSQEACEPVVTESILTLESKGLQQYEAYRKEVLEEGTKSVHDTIKKNSIPLLDTPLRRVMTPTGKKLKAQAMNTSLFSHLVIVFGKRDVPLLKVFSYEFHWFAPAISNFGELYLPSKKSDLAKIIVSECHQLPADLDPFDSYIYDGGRLHYWRKAKPGQTFGQYAEEVIAFIDIFFKIYKFTSQHIVFDVYRANSLKAATREKRGKGTRRVVQASNKCPNNWQDFLRDSENKTSLNKFLAEALTAHSYERGKQVFVTHEENVLSNSSTTMSDCNHEEADTRMLVHVEHSLVSGAQTIGINSQDTDVLIIVLGFFHQLQARYNFNDIVIDFGLTNRYSVSTIAEKLGTTVCQALPFFHALTGCDTTSAFKNIGKKTAYEVMIKVLPDIQNTFSTFFFNPFKQITKESPEFKAIERFVILLYSRTSPHTSVNEARMEMYFQKTQNLERVPPTADALLLHIKRAIFQTGVWATSLEPQQNLPSPSNFGWKRSDPTSNWEPQWISQGEASKECREFVKCGCKAPCSRCKCQNNNMQCTFLCTCSCDNKLSY